MSTVRKPITLLTELTAHDVIVRKGTDEKYIVTAVGESSALVRHPGRSYEVIKRADVLVDRYEVERPEDLPRGLTRTYSEGFDFLDWAGDKASITFDTGYRDGDTYGVGTPDARVIIAVVDGGSSIHIETPVLAYLLDQATEYRARRGD